MIRFTRTNLIADYLIGLSAYNVEIKQMKARWRLIAALFDLMLYSYRVALLTS